MSEHPITSLMNDTMDKIKQMVDANTIIGEPIKTDDGITLVPISRVSFGFGSGGLDYTSKHAKENAPLCFGGGGGAGVTVTPVAFVVMDKNGAHILPVNQQASSTSDRLVEMIPGAVSMVQNFLDKRKQEKDKGAETPEAPDLELDPEV